MAIRVGINGFGRIGRNLYRAAMDDKDIEIVAVNDITDPETLAHLLKYDSVLGKLKANVSSGEANVKVDGKSIKVFKEKDPAKIEWPSMDVSVVVESTGLFTNAEDARKHLRGPVKKVIVSASTTRLMIPRNTPLFPTRLARQTVSHRLPKFFMKRLESKADS